MGRFLRISKDGRSYSPLRVIVPPRDTLPHAVGRFEIGRWSPIRRLLPLGHRNFVTNCFPIFLSVEGQTRASGWASAQLLALVYIGSHLALHTWRRECGELRRRAPWNKAHLINYLAEVRGYRHYLELCTPTSGGRYAEIDRSKFATCLRLMYQCPESYVPADGLTIDYRTTGLDISECLSRMREDGQCVDIALIDSFHEYESSLRDLREGFRLISEGGTLVVHDCLPPTAELAQPKFIPGEWCGVTYQAFIDFVSNRDDLEFYTVDTDYGCGIIHKQAKPATPAASAGFSTSTGRLILGPDVSQTGKPSATTLGQLFRFLRRTSGHL